MTRRNTFIYNYTVLLILSTHQISEDKDFTKEEDQKWGTWRYGSVNNMKVRVMKTENPVEDKGTRLPTVPTLFPWSIQSSQLCKINNKENVLASCFSPISYDLCNKIYWIGGTAKSRSKMSIHTNYIWLLFCVEDTVAREWVITISLPAVTKIYFLLTKSIEYQADKWNEYWKISIRGLSSDPLPNSPYENRKQCTADSMENH